MKKEFTSIDPQSVLAKVAALPLQELSYIADEDRSRHIGPMAQGFSAAFGLGADEKHMRSKRRTECTSG